LAVVEYEDGSAPNMLRINKLSSRVKLRLKKNESLTGDELELALSAMLDEKITNVRKVRPLMIMRSI
jgi:hypothetical protein